MVKSLFNNSLRKIILVMLFISAPGWASCPVYTQEQSFLIGKAYYTGLPYNAGYTLAAIVIQESFIGDWVVRTNTSATNDSFGITHIELTTSMYLEGVDNTWEARATIIPRLMEDDDYALSLALRKLKKHRGKAYVDMVAKYNGGGKASREYAAKVVEHVKMLVRCYNFVEYEAGMFDEDGVDWKL